MKLCRFGPVGHEKPGVIDADGHVRDVSSLLPDHDLTLLTIHEIVAMVSSRALSSLPLVPADTRLGVPVARIGKIVCAGMNYADHCAEAGVPVPSEPAIFMKATSALAGPHDEIRVPTGATKLDWEAELAAVMGTRASNVSQQEALEHVAGYTILNDVSERVFQFDRGGQWVKGKSCDTFAPLGPWLVTPDEIGDPQTLTIELDVDGEPMQRGHTGRMVFGVAHLIHHISSYMTLLPGDVVSTGTPPGVGMGLKPPRYLRSGETVEIRIHRLGTQRQRVL